MIYAITVIITGKYLSKTEIKALVLVKFKF